MTSSSVDLRNVKADLFILFEQIGFSVSSCDVIVYSDARNRIKTKYTFTGTIDSHLLDTPRLFTIDRVVFDHKLIVLSTYQNILK